MVDVDRLEELCNADIERVLNLIKVDFRYNNGWICMDCCFHKSNGGFNLKYRDGYWYCFSECRRTYRTIDIVSKVMGLGFYDTLIFLQDNLDIDCNKSDDEQAEGYRESMALLKRYSAIKKSVAVKYNPVPSYILNDIEPYYGPEIARWGISRETAETFGLGIALHGEFRDRICFPIDAPDGTIIGVTGRLLGDSVGDKPKYHHLKDMQVGNTLYNISRASGYAKEMGYVIVVEGMKSVLKLWEWGYKNSVAVFGASLEDQQAKLLLKLGVKIVVIGDNDKAGRRMSQSCYNKCYKYGQVIQLNIGNVTDKEKDAVHDIDKDTFERLLRMEGVI